MVKAARTAPSPRTLLPLNRPEPLRVEAKSGWPVALYAREPACREITAVDDVWRIEEEWWRDAPIVRTYFDVTLDDGRRFTLFFDHGESCWYRQHYGP